MLSAAKWGALVGVAMYIILQLDLDYLAVHAGAGSIDPNHPGQITLGCLELLLILFAFSTSGFYAGRETRQAGYGAIAGMVTFAVYGVLLSIYSYGRTSSSGRQGWNHRPAGRHRVDLGHALPRHRRADRLARRTPRRHAGPRPRRAPRPGETRGSP